jgi:hypothetical protein
VGKKRSLVVFVLLRLSFEDDLPADLDLER